MRFPTSRNIVKFLIPLLLASTQAACGGGGGGENADATASTESSSSCIGSFPTTISVTPVSQPAPTYPSVSGPATVITTVRFENTGTSTQTNVPFTFGHVFAAGDLSTGQSLAGKLLSNNSYIPLQTDVKATHGGASVRHAIISGVIPSLPVGTTTMELTKATLSAAASSPTPANLAANGFTGNLNILVNCVAYTASLDSVLGSATPTTWLSGPIVNEWIYSVPFKTVSGGVPHPHLTARFAVRSYTGQKKVKVDVIIENNKTFEAAPQNFVYDVNVIVDSQSVYTQAALTHYHHARWRKSFWWGSTEPAVHIKHNTAYLIATKAVSNYDQSIIPAESALATLAANLTDEKIGPMRLGLLAPYMPQSGGRPDIGPLPSWSVLYLLSMDKRAKKVMLAIADGAGTWPIHYRDETTDYPVRLDNAINKNISTHGNLAHLGPLPVPRCATTAPQLCKTMYKKTSSSNAEEMVPDVAHQPSMVYLPYLITGDYYYLEELQFWAAWNPLETSAGSRGYEQGLMKWAQVRGQAWSLRTLAHAAYITPDAHPMKAYFTGQIASNLAFYNIAYTNANPNQLGVYDGSSDGVNGSAFVSDSGQSAPWQDDFFTWSAGYLAELGFADAQPLLAWKAKYPVGRMTAAGYCWIDGAVYVLQIRASSGSPVYTTFAEAYTETKKNENTAQTQARSANGDPSFNSASTYLSQPCNSQAQADWRTNAQDNSSGTWVVGQMTGFASSAFGFPANMQPALAVAATSGIPNATQAWTVFSGRAKKPDYTSEPQWAIVPR